MPRGRGLHEVFLRARHQYISRGKELDDVDDVLLSLERLTAKSDSRYIAALVAAIREEMVAARGGIPTTHRVLQELGYMGWSRLLSYRPMAAGSDGSRP